MGKAEPALAAESSTTTPAVVSREGDRFQVLSLDGGGILGLFTAALLARVEEDLGHPILEQFDLVVGTSTGGIIALGLGAGLEPAAIVDLYATKMTTVFPGSRRRPGVRRLVRPKYDGRGLEGLLREMLGDTLLAESRVPLVVPSFDIGENKTYLFKTPHHQRLRRDWKVPMWQVAMATSAAPTYFPAYCLPSDQVRLIDGGVWANNPVMVGVVEAVSMFNQSLSDIRVLSIGTTSDATGRMRRLDNAGLIQWTRSPNIANVLLRGQSIGAFDEVLHLLGASNAVRLDPAPPPGIARLDAADVRDLIAKAAHLSRDFCPIFEATFANHLPDPYHPIYGPRAESRSTYVHDD